MATRSNDALVRQAAVEALGRLGLFHDAKLLGDRSKLVQRTAAWALGRLSRHPEHAGYGHRDGAGVAGRSDAMGRDTRLFARTSPRSRAREIASSLVRVAKADPVQWFGCMRFDGLWQFWFWTRIRRRRARSRIPCWLRSEKRASVGERSSSDCDLQSCRREYSLSVQQLGCPACAARGSRPSDSREASGGVEARG